MKNVFFILLFVSQIVFASLPLGIHYGNINGLKNEFVKSIAQDNSGYMWIGTAKGLYKFDGVRFVEIDIKPTNSNLAIKKIFTDNNTIWIATSSNGLFSFQNNKWHSLKDQRSNNSLVVKTFYKAKKGELWLGTTDGLKIINSENKISEFSSMYFDIGIRSPVTKILKFTEDKFLFAYTGGFLICDLKNKKYKKYQPDVLNKVRINDVLIENQELIWLATSQSLIKYNLKNNVSHEVIVSENPVLFTALIHYDNYIFASTHENGLIKINLMDNSYEQFKDSSKETLGIKDNSISQLFLSDEHILWLGNYFKGLTSINLNSLNFNYETNEPNSVFCSKSNIFFSGYLDKQNNLWLGTSEGLVKYNEKNQSCELIKLAAKDNEMLSSITKIIEHKDQMYISTWKGMIVFDKERFKTIKIIERGKDIKNFFFMKDKIYFYDAFNGLFVIDNDIKHPIKSINVETKDLVFNDLVIDTDGKVYFATTKGLLMITQDHLTQYKPEKNIFTEPLESIAIQNNEFIVAIKNLGIYHIDRNGTIKTKYLYSSKLSNGLEVNKLLLNSNPSEVWLASNKGLIRFKNKKFHLFKDTDGINNYYFYRDFAFNGQDGQMYFGGQNGFVHFKPKDIILNFIPPPVVINNMSLMNDIVRVNQEYESSFEITKAINDLDFINLGYKDYIIGFEFSALDFADPQRNLYAYRLKGFNNNWVYTDANNRQATYTNLKPGDYTFQVKASNKDGVWSEKPKELKIKVYPAPWFSPWAYALYVLILMLSIWSYIRYKTIASRKRALVLEKTVAERTQEVVMQKKMVESLLDHKNEVFANITHEFKTPISLILGPVDELANESEPQNAEKISMIQRNAKRLMLMVGQILKLSQSEQDKEVIRESQSVQSTLLMLFESFKPLAKDKNITLTLDNQHDVNVYATSDCLEMVVGNLLSNALKFTNVGGEIKIKSEVSNQQVLISVKDSGSGIQEKDLDKIFNRFTRLETHKSIAGTGIGLAVVKEVTEANEGSVNVESQWGQGTTFTLDFPITEIKAIEDLSQDMVDQLVDNTANELVDRGATSTQKIIKNRVTVLIIEDNLDMQTHIGNVLKSHYNCLFADRGKEGIALALKEMPDIVICDVMMPEMDGYQVTRILRHDGRTSHIPIVLLTALNTKESRIKGWRENIDTYITKPFDATELKVQLQNILNIRKLLQQKTNKAIKSNDSLKALDLPKQDLKFIEKLKDVISQLYANEYIQKADIADKMAVSERQLQRKVKALIDENPMDMLRDYRLEKAAMKLKDGYQVGIVSDACGFSSVSYFGSCFKKKYGVTPKQYQWLDRKH